MFNIVMYQKVGIVVLGGFLGFLYYKLIGCNTGACPLTSNPYITIGYGAMVGALFT